MAQYVPRNMEWSARALQVRQFVFDYWAAQGRGPNLRQVHEGTQLARRDIVQAYKELQTGIVMVVDQDSPNCDILKIPPYSAFPSQVEMYVDEEFHSFIGCAHEAVAVSNMPHFKGKEVRLESYCACCLAPITFWSKEFTITRCEPADPLVHVASPVWDWVHDDMKAMCDNVNLVFDREHGERFEHQIGRRGVYFTLDQVRRYVEPAVGIRGWDYHWPSQSMDPERLVGVMHDLGIDLSPWGL
ncbi:MAG TPA: organomercurial lyase [Acidimicrobiia bacterium]|nr:organomercurial lyase [Acidimicrobiia bacterium]